MRPDTIAVLAGELTESAFTCRAFRSGGFCRLIHSDRRRFAVPTDGVFLPIFLVH
jgi:hypothetical protein